MGNTQPGNKTGKKVVLQKLENAQKTGILSLSEHNLDSCPTEVFQLANLRTLDLSTNKIKSLNPNIVNLSKLKILNLQGNELYAGSLNPIERLSNLQNLNVGQNHLGETRRVPSSSQPSSSKTTKITKTGTKSSSSRKTSTNNTNTTTTAATNNNNNNNKSIQQQHQPLPQTLPRGIKQLKLNSNNLLTVPQSVLALNKLEKLDLSYNRIVELPSDIGKLAMCVTEINLDFNTLTELPIGIGSLTKLKVLSLKGNRISVAATTTTGGGEKKRRQPLPVELFTDTPVIDLKLHGNPLTSTQLNNMDGFDKFLDRRQKLKTSTLIGGALTNLDVCGLE